jgi:hypothetical protein
MTYALRQPAGSPGGGGARARRPLCGLLCAALSLAALLAAPPARAAPAEVAAVNATLNRLHEAASRADGAAYFALFAPEAVFLGTDAGERWSLSEFKAYAMPYFAKGKGWTYVPRSRHVQFSPKGDVAWFDEILDNASYGVCRGSGVLRKAGDAWLVCQYHLTIPVPNELAGAVVRMIRERPSPSPAPQK